MKKRKRKSEKKSEVINRKDFLKLSATAGVGAAIVTGNNTIAKASGLDSKSKKPFTPFKKEYNSIDEIYDISSAYKRMNQKDTAFMRILWDKKLKSMGLSYMVKNGDMLPNPMAGEPGFSELDHALVLSSWSGHDAGAPHSAHGLRGRGNFNNWKRHANPGKKPYKFESKDEASKYVKRASSYLGAGVVGIAPYDERWTYSKWYEFSEEDILSNRPGKQVKGVFPFKPKSVIAVAFDMDYDAMKAPGYIADSAAGLEYSHMTEVTHKIAVFLNRLGYKAIPAGNDTGLSIPIAIQAGLGELSRMGTLINEKYGSRVRLAKVYTDLEMTFDKPISFGVQEFCKKCMKCADNCPSKAISVEDEPTVKPPITSISSHPGVTKWYQDNEKCFSQWERGGASCGICLSVCPYNKLDTWVHDLAKIVVGVPVGRDIARQMDDAFGYGEIKPENVEAFWNKDV